LSTRRTNRLVPEVVAHVAPAVAGVVATAAAVVADTVAAVAAAMVVAAAVAPPTVPAVAAEARTFLFRGRFGGLNSPPLDGGMKGGLVGQPSFVIAWRIIAFRGSLRLPPVAYGRR
jgi:hypothetical protein